PRNSKTMAIRIACLMVRAREPTEVPMALATSLAPTPQAMKKPNRQASTSRMVPYSAIRVISQNSFGWKCDGPSAGHDDSQAVPYPLCPVRHITDPLDDLVGEHHVHRGQYGFALVERGPQFDLHLVGIMLDALQFIDQILHQLDLTACEAGFHQIAQLANGLQSLGRSVHGANHEASECGLHIRMNLHLAAQHQP